MARPKRFELLTPRFVVCPYALILCGLSAKWPILSDRRINGLQGKCKMDFSPKAGQGIAMMRFPGDTRITLYVAGIGLVGVVAWKVVEAIHSGQWLW